MEKSKKKKFKVPHTLFLLLTSKCRILETILEERSKVWTRFLCVELPSGLCKNPAFTKCGIWPSLKVCEFCEICALCPLSISQQSVSVIVGCSVWLFYTSALNLILTTCQDSGKISLLNLAKQPLAEIQSCLPDICPSTGLFLLCAQEIQDWWCKLVFISDHQDLSS